MTIWIIITRKKNHNRFICSLKNCLQNKTSTGYFQSSWNFFFLKILQILDKFTLYTHFVTLKFGTLLQNLLYLPWIVFTPWNDDLTRCSTAEKTRWDSTGRVLTSMESERDFSTFIYKVKKLPIRHSQSENTLLLVLLLKVSKCGMNFNKRRWPIGNVIENQFFLLINCMLL